MKKNVLIVVNPVAGRGKAKKNISKIKNNIKKNDNYDVDVQYTTTEKNAAEIITQYDGNIDILFVCGGDGTLSEIMQAMGETNKKIPIAYLPNGTTNDFAKSLKKPFDMLTFSQDIESGSIEKVDVGKFNEHYFNYVVSTGLFSRTSYITPHIMKNILGRLAYIIIGATELFTCRPQKLKLYVNGEVIEERFIYGSISNSIYIGGFEIFRKYKDEIKLGDGEFEAVFIKKPKTVLGFIKLVVGGMIGNLKDKNILFFKVKEMTIESDKDTEWSIDGEYSGKVKKIHIKNMHQYAQYIIP